MSIYYRYYYAHLLDVNSCILQMRRINKLLNAMEFMSLEMFIIIVDSVLLQVVFLSVQDFIPN